MNNEPGQKTISEMLAPIFIALRRYWKLTLPPALALFAFIVFIALRLPSYYSADTLIYVQPQRVSSKIVETPQKDEMKERLEALVQEILSRPRLKSVIDRFQLYPQYRGVRGTERALKLFRNAIGIEPAKSTTGGTPLLQTFQLSYSDDDPQTAYEVTRALANLFIEESVVDQVTEVKGTVEFLDAQLSEARKRLEETENKVQQFVTANFGKLPEHNEQAVARLQSLQAQMDSNSQLIAANMTRRQNLDSELNEIKRIGVSAGTDDSGRSYDPNEALVQLEQALVVMQSRYTEQHPEVIQTKKKIQALREQLARSGGARTPTVRSGLSAANVLQVRREMSEVDVQLTSLREENIKLKEDISKLRKNIEEMPIKEQELLRIKRDYENVRVNYNRLLQAKQEAEIQESLTRSQKGAQFKIVEPAELPSMPAGPQRMLIISAAAVVALAVFLAVPIGLYFLNGAYRSKAELSDELGLRVLSVVPPMVTPEAVVRLKRQRLTSVAISAASFAALSVVVLFVL